MFIHMGGVGSSVDMELDEEQYSLAQIIDPYGKNCAKF